MADINVPVKAGPVVGDTQSLETILDVDVKNIPPLPVKEAKMLRLYKSTMFAVNFICGNGDVITFTQSKFYTDNERHIAYLDAEIKSGHPHIFVDPLEREVASNLITPMQQLRDKIRKELIEEMKAGPAHKDAGNTDQNAKLMPANTRDIAQAAAGSGPSFIKV